MKSVYRDKTNICPSLNPNHMTTSRCIFVLISSCANNFFFCRKYHHDDLRLPIFSFLRSQNQLSKKEKENAVFATLMTLIEEKPDPSHICSIPRRRVTENRSFLVDTSNLKDVNDVLADDSGSWVNNGQHRFHYELDEDGI